MLAAGIVVAVIAVMAVVGVLAAGWCGRVMLRRLERRSWDELEARNRDLDLDLTKIWRGR